jgi:two-component system, sensor histidine kinase and response regulator
MNAVIGMSRLCLGTSLQPQQRDYVEKTYRAGLSLLGIIDDILDFSKIEAGMLKMEAIPFHLHQVFDSLAGITAARAQEKGLELLLHLPANHTTPLVGDPLRLGQVLLNLVSNAVKFTDDGKIQVHATPLNITEDTALFEFRIHDTGIGMTPDQCGCVFQSFSQADTSTTRKYGGTGLGLAISKHLVEMMGGAIRLESEPGVGTTFIFTALFGCIPEDEIAKNSPAPASLKHPEAPLVDGVSINSGSGSDAWKIETLHDILQARILVVDDNEINQQIALELLHQAGLVVEIANNGQEAIDLIAHQHFDAVLMDIQMPVMDGFEATKAIRKLPAHEKLPIIAMTAHAMSGDRERSLEAGMNDHITKPIHPEVLYAALQRWIGVLHPAPASAPLLEAPSSRHLELDDIDTREGLHNHMGKEAFYLRILRIFQRDFSDAGSRMRELAKQGELGEARRLAHSVKSGAATIGAMALSGHARELEQALTEGQVVPALVGKFAESAQRIARSLEALPAEEPVSRSQSACAETLLPLLDKLEAFLADDDAAADDAFRSLRNAIATADPELDDLLARIGDLIEDIEYEKARELLAELKGKTICLS